MRPDVRLLEAAELDGDLESLQRARDQRPGGNGDDRVSRDVRTGQRRLLRPGSSGVEASDDEMQGTPVQRLHQIGIRALNPDDVGVQVIGKRLDQAYLGTGGCVILQHHPRRIVSDADAQRATTHIVQRAGSIAGSVTSAEQRRRRDESHRCSSAVHICRPRDSPSVIIFPFFGRRSPGKRGVRLTSTAHGSNRRDPHGDR